MSKQLQQRWGTIGLDIFLEDSFIWNRNQIRLCRPEVKGTIRCTPYLAKFSQTPIYYCVISDWRHGLVQPWLVVCHAISIISSPELVDESYGHSLVVPIASRKRSKCIVGNRIQDATTPLLPWTDPSWGLVSSDDEVDVFWPSLSITRANMTRWTSTDWVLQIANLLGSWLPTPAFNTVSAPVATTSTSALSWISLQTGHNCSPSRCRANTVWHHGSRPLDFLVQISWKIVFLNFGDTSCFAVLSDRIRFDFKFHDETMKHLFG